MALNCGSVVEVPLGNRRTTGVVWALDVAEESETGQIARSRLKLVIRALPVPPLPDAILKLVDWTAAYTLTAPGAILRMAISVPDAFEPPKPVTAYTVPSGGIEALETQEVRLTSARRRVLTLLADGPPRTAREIADEAGVGASVVKGLAEAGGLARVALPADIPFPEPDPDTPRATPSPLNSTKQPTRSARRSVRRISRRYCLMVRPAQERQKSISRQLRPHCGWASRYWSCCRKSHSLQNG